MKAWVIAVSIGLRESWYVESYFGTSISKNASQNKNYRYSMTYWDRMNKSIVDISRSISTTMQKMKSIKDLSEILSLLGDCYKASETFIDNGYLNSIFIPVQTKAELFGNFKELSISGLLAWSYSSNPSDEI